MGECSDSRRYSFQKLNTNTTETHSRCVEAAQGDGVVKCIGAFRRNYVTDNGASCGSLNMSILFVGLLEVILTKVESNIALRDALMKLILEKLTEAKIFPNLSGIITELEPLRKHYLSGFWKIIQEARKSVSSIVPLSGVQSSAIDLQTLSLPYPKNWFHDFLNASRYDDNFEELELLGQGGFGVVYKARNRVDLALYAVKKIFLKDFSHDNKLKILREARVIAGLKHSNIVCYHTAWLEYVPNIPDVFKCSSQTKSDSSTQSRIDLRGSNITSDFSSPYQQQEDSESEGGIIFEPLETEEVKRSSFEKNGLNLNEKGDIEKSESVSVEQDKSETSNASRKRSTPSFSRSFSCPHAVDSEIVQRTPKHCVDIASLRAPSYQNVSGCFALFIQMQLYQSSLKEWVTKRNQLAKGSWSCVEHNSNVQILKQILSGLKYIHAKNIVHRDLKLQNIFIDPKNCHVWIGDFGLARVIENIGANESQSDESLVRTPLIQEPVIGLSDGIGSYPYVAPELLNGSKAYSSKVDMFSLGIVLYELYRPFDTYMERAKTIETLKRTGNVPDETLLQNWPLVCSWINKLVSVDPNNRPTSTQLFDSVCREEPGQKISIGLNTSNSTSQETATLLQQMHTRLKSLEEENLKMKRIVQRTKVRERNRRRQNFKLRLQLLKFKQS